MGNERRLCSPSGLGLVCWTKPGTHVRGYAGSPISALGHPDNADPSLAARARDDKNKKRASGVGWAARARDDKSAGESLVEQFCGDDVTCRSGCCQCE